MKSASSARKWSCLSKRYHSYLPLPALQPHSALNCRLIHLRIGGGRKNTRHTPLVHNSLQSSHYLHALLAPASLIFRILWHSPQLQLFLLPLLHHREYRDDAQPMVWPAPTPVSLSPAGWCHQAERRDCGRDPTTARFPRCRWTSVGYRRVLSSHVGRAPQRRCPHALGSSCSGG
jgi:hypothetical protein